MDFEIEKHTIYLTVHGSRAYGTNVSTSDTDYKGVAIPPKEYLLGHAFNFEQKEELVSKGHPHDKTVFELKKFMSLAADCNPNIIEVLHTASSDVVLVTKLGERLLENRDLFLSKKAKFRFSGYAHSQLKRIQTHRSWLLTPPGAKPQRSDYGLPEEGNKIVGGSVMGAFDELSAAGYSFGSEVMMGIQKEKQYASALQHWKQYMNWKETRNADRAELEAKHGFDTKHGMHLIRLMRMCNEILEGKGVLVKRPDADELRDIRHGAWSFDKLLEEAGKLEVKANALYETSLLPDVPPVHTLNNLCVELIESFLSGKLT